MSLQYKSKIAVFIFLINSLLSCADRELRPLKMGHTESSDSINKSFNNLTENQKKILLGAKRCLDEKFTYDTEMAYRLLEYIDGRFVGSKVYPGGDLNPELGVCTDVIIRALRFADIIDLQQAIHEDILSNWDDYPMKRWKAKKPDTNIDHRRVPNHFVWFGKYWKTLKGRDFQPGDVIVWDMNGDSWADHIGIVSDKLENDNYYIIHNFPSPGYVAEEDVLYRWEIIGHFRINN